MGFSGERVNRRTLLPTAWAAQTDRRDAIPESAACPLDCFGAKRRLAMMGWTAPDGIISATLVYVSFQRKENRP